MKTHKYGSKLILNGATLHATVTGIQLTNGQLHVLRDSSFCVETIITYSGEDSSFINEGITIGDGIEQNDLECDIYSGATLNITGGTLNYRNVNSSSWNMHNVSSKLYMHQNTLLNLYESIDFDNGILVLGDRSRVGIVENKSIVGSVSPIGRYSTVNF